MVSMCMSPCLDVLLSRTKLPLIKWKAETHDTLFGRGQFLESIDVDYLSEFLLVRFSHWSFPVWLCISSQSPKRWQPYATYAEHILNYQIFSSLFE
jgi:hypothetical protein